MEVDVSRKKKTKAKQKNRQQNKARKSQKRIMHKKKRAAAENALPPAKQRDDNWFVPIVDEHACIYHGHDDSDDHSLCGPQIFCCPNASRVLLEIHEAAIEAEAQWYDMKGADLLEWSGPNLFYFWFCDPNDSDSIYFTGVEKDDLPSVLLGRRSIHDWIDVSDRLTAPT